MKLYSVETHYIRFALPMSICIRIYIYIYIYLVGYHPMNKVVAVIVETLHINLSVSTPP